MHGRLRFCQGIAFFLWVVQNLEFMDAVGVAGAGAGVDIRAEKALRQLGEPAGWLEVPES